MKYTVVERPEMRVVGITVRTTNRNDQFMQDIPNAWNRFREENIFDKIPYKKTDEVLGVYLDYEEDYTKPYTLLIGCEVTETNGLYEGLTQKTIPASKYALIRPQGKFPQCLIEAWEKVWDSDLPRRYSADIEIYGKDLESVPPDLNLLISLR